MMIAYLEGTLFKKEEERIILLVNRVGYEILLPAMTAESLKDMPPETELALHIYHYQTERQPRPILIGFQTEEDKAFFQLFLTVEDIGPMKAVKAMTLPVAEMASLIEKNDIHALSSLKGVGKRTAQKIVATLAGKTERFFGGISPAMGAGLSSRQKDDFVRMVKELLTSQMGHGSIEADRLIAGALAARPDITTPEALLEEVYKARIPDGGRR